MKMTTEHYRELHNAIAGVVEQRPDELAAHRDSLIAGKIPSLDPPTRFRWDCLWFANAKAIAAGGKGLYGVLGHYKDTHIDTALRSIMRELRLWQ